MAYQKLQVGKGLNVIISNTVNIPNPDTLAVSGSSSGDFQTVPGTIDDGTVDYIASGVKVGDIVYNTTAGVAYYVTGVISASSLTVSPATAGGTTDSYDIYSEATQGCVLFVGGAGNLRLQLTTPTSGVGDGLIFKGIAAGAFLPTQVVRVDSNATTATDIIALW